MLSSCAGFMIKWKPVYLVDILRNKLRSGADRVRYLVSIR